MEPDNISSCDLQHVFGVNSAMLSKLAPRVWRCGIKKALVQIHAIGTDLHPLLRDGLPVAVARTMLKAQAELRARALSSGSSTAINKSPN